MWSLSQLTLNPAGCLVFPIPPLRSCLPSASAYAGSLLHVSVPLGAARQEETCWHASAFSVTWSGLRRLGLQDTIGVTEGGGNISSAITFFSDEYFEAGWRRTALAAKAVRWGFHLLITDVDIVWFQNPYKYLVGVQVHPSCLLLHHHHAPAAVRYCFWATTEQHSSLHCSRASKPTPEAIAAISCMCPSSMQEQLCSTKS